jgi:hypothetical protein
MAPAAAGWGAAGANLLAYGLSTAVTFGLGTRGFLGARTNKEVSAAFPTLCTPAGWAFAIWGPIFMLEGGSMLWHLFGAPAADRFVLDSSSTAWCTVCALQAAWTAAFSFDQMALSVPLLAGIPYGLASVYGTARQGLSPSMSSYVLGELPFSLHYSWTACASLVNLNLLAVSMGASPAIQVALAAASQLGAAGFGAVESWRRADPVPAFVGGWALLAISVNDGAAKSRILASVGGATPGLAARVHGLTAMSRVLGQGLALLGTGILAGNMLGQLPAQKDR